MYASLMIEPKGQSFKPFHFYRPKKVAEAAVSSKAVVLLLLTCCLLLLPLRESVIVLCFVVLYFVHSSFASILMGKRELVPLLSLSSWCCVIVVWLFLAVPWVCLQFVIVVSPDHNHFLGKQCISR